MSMIHCDSCDKNIDTDFNAEHLEDCEPSKYEQSLKEMYELGLEHGRELALKEAEIERLKKELEYERV